MSINESNIFEENDLYIQGQCLRTTISNIKKNFEQLFEDVIGNEDDYTLEELYDNLE